MPVQFILGRAGSGKTRACLDAVLEELTHDDRQTRAILLVPEQASFQMERALATRSARGGYSRAEVLSFSRLARRLLGALGDVPEALSPAARSLALRAVTARLSPPLESFGRTPTAGFFAHLDGVIESLLRENITAPALDETAARIVDPFTRARVCELSRLYAAYLTWLGPQRIDAAQRLALLRTRVAEADWLRGARIWVDGFAGFTGQELATLTALAGVAADLTITLLLDPSHTRGPQGSSLAPSDIDPHSLFHRTEQTYQRLRADLAAAGINCVPDTHLAPTPPPRFLNAPDIARLEAALAGAGNSTPASTRPNSGEVHIFECESPREELRTAARDIQIRIAAANGTLRYRDFAVITRDIEPLCETIAEVFDEFDIPYFLDRRRPLHAHPLHRVVAALFDAARDDCRRETLVRLLRTGLTPLSRIDAEALDELLVAHDVSGAAPWQADSWPFADDPRNAGPRLTPSLNVARRTLAAALRPLCNLSSEPRPLTGEVWAAALLRALESLDIRATLEQWIAAARAEQRWEAAEVHRLAWDGLCETLENLGSVLHETPLTLADAAHVVVDALGALTLGLAPPKLDQVLISSIDRSRHPDIRCAWLVGFNEGVFPRRPADDRLLSASDRERVAAAGLPALASAIDDAFGERLLAYIAVTRPSHAMTISYARSDAAGEPAQPSPLLGDMLAALPGLLVERPHADSPPLRLSEAARGYLVVQRDARGGARNAARYERLVAALRRESPIAERLARLLRGLDYSNDPAPLALDTPAEPAALIWRGAPSELETYLQCPFKHYASRRLRLNPQRLARPLVQEIGEIAHAILADVTQRAIAARSPMNAIDAATWSDWLARAWDAWAARQLPGSDARRPERAFAIRRLRRFVDEVVKVHAERWRRGAFRPVLCEARFAASPGTDATASDFGAAAAESALLLPPLRLPTADGRIVELTGKIDRVDEAVAPDGSVWRLIYDYKSSPSGTGGSYLTGAALQLFAYLLAATTPLGSDDKAARPAGVLIAPLFPQFDGGLPKYAEEWNERDQTLFLYRPDGKLDTAAAALLDPATTVGHSPVAKIKRNRDGGFEKRGDARPGAEITARLDLARRTVLQAATGIASGAIDVAPLVQRRTLACTNCEFASLCRFERPLNRPRAAESQLPQLRMAGDADVEE